ncbi:MAG: phytanoyl-CoA dioxygenase family protein [Novosphingobium sp.]
MVNGIRDLTCGEVATYRAKGWVHAPGLIPRGLAKRLLARSRAVMGDTAHTISGGGGGDPEFAEYASILRNYLGIWKIEPLMREVSHSISLARVASQLLHDRPVRFFNDEVLVKPPAEAGGRATPWHQDLPHSPFERTGLINIWISLVDLPADGGAMSFLDGSHRVGPLGRTLLDKTDVLEQNPWLRGECEISPPAAMKVGDATIHGDMTIHSGPAYKGSHWRWAYLVNLMDASMRYSGGPSYGEKIEGLEPNAPFPEDRFPVLYGG